MAPDDVHNMLCILLAHAYVGPSHFPAVAPDGVQGAMQRREAVSVASPGAKVAKVDFGETALQRLASNNPIATTAVFKHLLANVHANLVGLSTARLSNEPLEARPRRGLWGMNTCHRAVVECNDRASQHIHGMLHGGLTPALVADVAADEGIVREVARQLLPNVSADASLASAGLTPDLAVELHTRLVARLGVLGHAVNLPEAVATRFPTLRHFEEYLEQFPTLRHLEEYLAEAMSKEEDAPPVVGLRQQAMDALDTQVQGALPLVYHALYLAQRVLHVGARRDVAHDVPSPPPTEEEWKSGKAYADSKREHQEDYSAYLHQWVDIFHRRHRAADVFARIANGCEKLSRGRAKYDRLDYEDCRDEIWWPTFLHHARIVVMNRHSHEHCKSCTKTERGKIGCRFCALWPHGVQRTQCSQLRPKEIFDETVGDANADEAGARTWDAEGDVSMGDSSPTDGGVAALAATACVASTRGREPCRCMVCYADGALHAVHTTSGKDRQQAIDAVAKEDRLRDMYYEEVDVAEDPRTREPSGVAPGEQEYRTDATPAELDDRILAVEIARPHLPAAAEQLYCQSTGDESRACGRLLFLCTCTAKASGPAGQARFRECTVQLERRHARDGARPDPSEPSELDEGEMRCEEAMDDGEWGFDAPMNDGVVADDVGASDTETDADSDDPYLPYSNAAPEADATQATARCPSRQDDCLSDVGSSGDGAASGGAAFGAEESGFNFSCTLGCQCAAKLADDGAEETFHQLAWLVETATAERRPCPFLHEGVFDSARKDPLAVEHQPVVANARAMLRRLVAPGQPLRTVLHSGDCCELRHAIYKLAEEPRPEPEEPAAAEAYRTEAGVRARALFDLLAEWTWSPSGAKMACRNGLIADYNIVMAGCVRGNAVPYSLGAGAGSKAGAMYQIKCVLPPCGRRTSPPNRHHQLDAPLSRRYMGKESVQISAAATLLADAHKHVHDPLTRSRAEDAGEPERNARHYLQHVLNASNMELEATQAAGIVLGMPSSVGSHSNEYHGAWDAVALAETASKSESDTDGLLALCADRDDADKGGAAAAEEEAERGGVEEEEEEDEADAMVDVAQGEADGCEEEEVEEDEDAAGGEPVTSDDEALLASVFEQPATERSSRREWVIAEARHAVARHAVRRAQGAAVGRAESDGAENVDGGAAGGDGTVTVEAQTDGGFDDGDGGGHEADGAIECGPEALPDGVERIDLEKHFHTDQGGSEGASAQPYRDADGNPVLLCKMHHFAWRANELECFNALEFTSLFDIRAMTKQDRVWHRARARRIRYVAAWSCYFFRALLKDVRAKRADVVAHVHGQPTALEPLTLGNAVGRRVLVPSSRWPAWPCDEHCETDCNGLRTSRGKGWEAVVLDEVAVSAGAVRVRLLYVRDGAKNKWLDPPVVAELELPALRPLCLPPIMEHMCKPAAIEPLTLANAPGRRVLVPAAVWSAYPCTERGGEGWEATVKSTSSRGRNNVGEKVESARIDFCFARDKNGRLYKSEMVELAVLRPLRTPPSPARGRPTYRYVLRDPHPLASNYVIFRRSKWGVPALAGRPPPSLPSTSTGQTSTLAMGLRARRKKEADFVRYFVANLVPWSAWRKPKLTLEHWRIHVKELEDAACLHREKDALEKAGEACCPPWAREPGPDDEKRPPLGFCEARRARLVAASRLAHIENIVQGFKAPRLASVLLMKHRSRARTIWNAANPRPEGADGEDMTAGQREAVKEIRKLREKAERLRDTKSIATRLNAAHASKAWADALRNELPAMATHPASATARLRELWRCASEPARRTVDHRSRNRDPVDVSAANKQPLSMHGGEGASASRDASRGGSQDIDVPPADDDPFSPIDDAGYRRAKADYEASKRAGLAVGDAPLNPEQRDGGREFLRVAQLRRDALRRGEPIQRVASAIARDGITLVVGAGGTGKSNMVHQLQQQMAARDCGKLLITAYTGVAAAPFRGPTLLSLFNMRIDTKSTKRVDYVRPAYRDQLRKKFEEESGIKVEELGGIVIDEVSFIELGTFGHVDGRLRALTDNMDLLCGGVPILLCGDNHQKPPPAGTPWYRLLVQNALEDGALVAEGPSMAVSRGLRLLHAARRVELKRLMRVNEGEDEFAGYLQQMRDIGHEQPVPSGLLSKLRKVSADDLARDPEWRFAPVGAISHVERDAVNLHQLEAFARHFALPLVKWRCKMVDEIDDRALRDDLYADEPNLWQYFVEGAPVNLTCAPRRRHTLLHLVVLSHRR